MKPTEEAPFYVQISDSNTVRKSLLGNSRQVIQLLKRYEQLKMIRSRKMEELIKLRKANKEISIMLTKIKRLMPKSEMRVKVSRDAPRKQPAVSERQQNIPQTELQRLEAELKDIESKIGRI